MLTGECLCGRVRFEIDGKISVIWFCHCSKCLKSSGTAFRAGAVCGRSRFRWLRGSESIREHRTPSGYVSRFCPTCGSTVPMFPAETELVWLPVGALDGDPGSRPDHHIFTGSKAEWYEIRDELRRFERSAVEPA